MKIILGAVLLVIASYANRIPTYFDNKNRERFLNKLKSNSCNNVEIARELKNYFYIVDRVIKIYTLRGSYESELMIFKDELSKLYEKANKNILTKDDRNNIENIFTQKLRTISWFPFFISQEKLNKKFLWISK